MSNFCSQCKGAGKIAVKYSIKKIKCCCCNGTGRSPDPNTEMELAAFLKTKKRPVFGAETGSFECFS